MKVLISEGHRAALDYYRKCRTAVVHPTEETRAEAESCFEQNALALAQLREAYGEYRMPGAPNAFDQLTFQDVKMLARLVLEIARIISSAFDPGDDQIATTVPIRNWARLSHDRERLRQRVAGYLRTTFGLDVARADRIADIAVGSLA